MKRTFDILAILLTLPLTIPLIAITGVVVLAVQGWPVFFVQERAGMGGRAFKMVKFRTMRNGTGSDAERLTGLGRFLRSSSLDELPELWNVLKGDMSLVGPRPLPISYLSRYTTEQNHRHDVLPGITGWAQVNGRNSLDWEAKFRYDLEYVNRRSFAFDLKILAKTIAQVVGRRGISHEGEATMGEFLGVKG